MPTFPKEIEYSEKYSDDLYEYRHVILPRTISKKMPKGKILAEAEWRGLGISQSRGWAHYAIHKPEPNILLFRRPKGNLIIRFNHGLHAWICSSWVFENIDMSVMH